MANNTTLRDGNGALFTAESFDVGSGLQRTSTAANLRVANADVSLANPVSSQPIIAGAVVSTANPLPVSGAVTVSETAGTAITGAAMPPGGAGLTGWLSAIWSALDGLIKANLYVNGALAGPSNGVAIYDAYIAPVQNAAWTSATTANTAFTLTTNGMDTVVLTAAVSGTLTAGAIIFEAFDGYNWVNVKAPRTDSYLTEGTFLLAGSATHSWQVPVAGYPQFRARLSTAVAGTGSVQLVGVVSSAPDTSIVTVGLDPSQPLPAGTNLIGQVQDTNSAAFAGAVAMTVGTAYTAQRSLGVLCTIAGNVSVTFPDASTLVLPVYVGWQTFPFAVTAVNASGTTATATYYNLK